jgi:hypothetical protein
MAFKYNPATSKWEQQKQPRGSSAIGATGMPGVIGGGRGSSAVGATGRPQPVPSKTTSSKPKSTPSITPTGGGSQPPAPVSPAGPQLSQVVPSGQGAIDAAWQAIYDEADNYYAITGEQPPPSWWSTKTAQVENIQKRFDAEQKAAADATKAGASAAAAAAKAKAEAEKEERERVRKVRGGREAESFLRTQADTRKAEMMKRVAELYDPLQNKTEADMTRMLEAASQAYDAAESQVRAAGEDFTKGFTPSKAYSEIPLSTYTTAENPLLAALQQQGAGTGDVTAATEEANQFMAQQSALEMWAAGQLNVGQQNYDTAVQQAAKGGLAAALQGLAGRRADVKTGIEQQFADALSKIAQERTTATSTVDEKIADIIAKADEIRAETTSEYGNLPKEEKPAPAPVVAPKPAPKPVVAPAQGTTKKEEEKKKKAPVLSSIIRRS